MFKLFLHWQNLGREKKKDTMAAYGIETEAYFASAKARAEKSNMVGRLWCVRML